MSKFKMLLAIMILTQMHTLFAQAAVIAKNTIAVKCGDVITASATIANDLNCPNTTGFALIIEGNNIVVNGNNHLISAPNAEAGILISGNSISVSGFHINGIANGYGIFAYDSPGATIARNNVSNNLIGIQLYAESKQMSGVTVNGNTASGNVFFGIRTSQDGAGGIVNPNITSNDFSISGSYGMYIEASSYLSTNSSNSFKGSLNGLYLRGGRFTINGILLTNQLIKNAQIFVDSAAYVELNNPILGNQLPPLASEERIGLILYRVAQFKISGLLSTGNDIAMKLETEQGVHTTGVIQNSVFLVPTIAGILIESTDGTAFGNIQSTSSIYEEWTPAVGISVVPGTVANIISSHDTLLSMKKPK